MLLSSCEEDQHGLNSFNEDIQTIRQFLENNQEEYSKFFSLLNETRLLNTLGAYNPYGEGYTLFLPTDEAIDIFLQENQDYANFDALMLDTGFVDTLVRYHTINRKVHTDEFSYGALTDRTLSGNRLTVGVYQDGDKAEIRINNLAPIIRGNMEMTNGNIHVISRVLQQVKTSGYDWLQQEEDYSILAEAMELARIDDRLWMETYTIFAEHDSIYNRYGIYNIDDLIDRIADSWLDLSDRQNSFYQFAAYHIMNGEYYLNDFYWGSRNYRTLGNDRIEVDAGQKIRINPGVDTYGLNISEYGDTTIINYIGLIWDGCNVLTSTGPVHSVSEILVEDAFPD